MVRVGDVVVVIVMLLLLLMLLLLKKTKTIRLRGSLGEFADHAIEAVGGLGEAVRVAVCKPTP